MTNTERLNQAYTDLCIDLVSAVEDLDNTKTYEDYDSGLKTIDSITVILKRFGEINSLDDVRIKEDIVVEDIERKGE